MKSWYGIRFARAEINSKGSFIARNKIYSMRFSLKCQSKFHENLFEEFTNVLNMWNRWRANFQAHNKNMSSKWISHKSVLKVCSYLLHNSKL